MTVGSGGSTALADHAAKADDNTLTGSAAVADRTNCSLANASGCAPDIDRITVT